MGTMSAGKSINLKTDEDLEKMRKAGRITGAVLKELRAMIRPGVTGLELDAFAEEYIRSQGAEPAFLGYFDFPNTLCISINDEVVHGIPKKSELVEGDIVSIDVGAKIEGFFGDAARTFAVGDIKYEYTNIISVTEQAKEAGIRQAIIGNRIGAIGEAVQTIAEEYAYGVVRTLAGHGIGKALHEPPTVFNYGSKDKGALIKKGLCIAIEPMLTLGKHEVETMEDEWTVKTVDRKFSAHFEDTIAVTEDGPEILTKEPEDE